MPGPGFYSWVCFIDVQQGAWFGPIAQEQIEDYEEGFALDDNIKSFTEFEHYEDEPTDPLTCNFNKRVAVRRARSPKTITFAKCSSRNRSASESTRRTDLARVVNAWSALPPHIQHTIVALVGASAQTRASAED